jgi:hypothetical protein
LAAVKLVMFVLALFVSNVSAAQMFVGLGTSYNFFSKPFITNEIWNATAGGYAKRTDRFEIGGQLVVQSHDYVTARHSQLFGNDKTYVEQLGLTPLIFTGYRLDRFLSLGLAGGYEMLSKDRTQRTRVRPFELVSDRETHYQTGRWVGGVYAMVNVFQNTSLSPAINVRYTVMPGNGNTVHDVALSVCLLWRYNKQEL